ncbi:UPF0481 protein At3g47200-like [Neltuma alba]|uniref:UPF0481 protein At3g47200-like n=1 Tax=Neltuma alba TaxID=207710 RepID=UPI0010A55E69|nr:UPF0481 protein At3g47200-like [Prosopis alba]
MIQDCGDGHLLPSCCIYWVPIRLRHLKPESYTPKVVLIGPFQYGNERLQGMERHKQILFKGFSQRAISSLDDLVHLAKHLEPKVRASYSESINFTEQELVKLTLMDAGFIIELFIMSYEMDELHNDAKLSLKWLLGSILHDLLLFQNQLPFFVIEELFNKSFPLTVVVVCPASIKLKANKSKCLLALKFSRQVLKIPQTSVDDETELLFHNMIALEQCHYPYKSYITNYAIILDRLIDTYKDADLLIRNKIINNHLGHSNKVALLFNGLWECHSIEFQL